VSRESRIALAIVAAVVGLDQATKWIVVQSMELHQSLPVISGVFNLTYVRNSGAAFGLFADLPSAVRAPIFAALSVGALVLLLFLLRGLRPDQWGMRVALACVLGGAIGNLIDRVRDGEVVDFLDVYWQGYHWPAFNVADSFITLGVVAILLSSFRSGPSADLA
jgi:signal peptidase II